MISQPVSLIRSLVLICVAMAAISACSSQPSTRHTDTTVSTAIVLPAPEKGIGARAAAVAVEQVGIPYRYGGSTPSGFDCSGLVYYSYSRLGKSVPRTTGQLWSSAIPVKRDELRAGDVLFFSMSGKISHVGMYLGDDQFVHAPSTGKVVSIQTLRSAYYEKAFVRAGRPK
jgi:cell wall-associated NlpC family hydrolase